MVHSSGQSQLGAHYELATWWSATTVYCAASRIHDSLSVNMDLSIYHFVVQMYLQFPIDNLFQLMWERKSPPRMFKSMSIIHVLKSWGHITHAIERLLMKTPNFSHAVAVTILNHYMSTYHRKVSQRADVDLEKLMYKWFSFYQWTTSRKAIKTKSRPLFSLWGSHESFWSSHLDLIKQSRLPWRSQLRSQFWRGTMISHWRWVHLKPSSFILLKKIGI